MLIRILTHMAHYIAAPSNTNKSLLKTQHGGQLKLRSNHIFDNNNQHTQSKKIITKPY